MCLMPLHGHSLPCKFFKLNSYAITLETSLTTGFVSIHKFIQILDTFVYKIHSLTCKHKCQPMRIYLTNHIYSLHQHQIKQ